MKCYEEHRLHNDDGYFLSLQGQIFQKCISSILIHLHSLDFAGNDDDNKVDVVKKMEKSHLNSKPRP